MAIFCKIIQSAAIEEVVHQWRDNHPRHVLQDTKHHRIFPDRRSALFMPQSKAKENNWRTSDVLFCHAFENRTWMCTYEGATINLFSCHLNFSASCRVTYGVNVNFTGKIFGYACLDGVQQLYWLTCIALHDHLKMCGTWHSNWICFYTMHMKIIQHRRNNFHGTFYQT